MHFTPSQPLSLHLILNYSFLASLFLSLSFLSVWSVYSAPVFLFPPNTSLRFTPLSLSLCCFSTQKMKNRAICAGTASRIAVLMFLLRQLSVSLCRPRPLQPCPAGMCADSWRALRCRTTRRQLSGRAYSDETGSVNEASGSLCRVAIPCTMAV